jgi:hypothetical protein
MNKDEELVIRYLSGELSRDELLNIELKINNSPELKKFYEEYSKVFNKVNEQKSVEGNYYYFENILQRFYSGNKSDIRKGFFRSLAYASIIIIFMSVSYIFFNDYQSKGEINLNTITQEVSSDQILKIIDEYSLVDNSDLTSISPNSFLDQQINSFYDNSLQNIANHLEVSDITDQLSESETNRIYSELINKKIL